MQLRDVQHLCERPAPYRFFLALGVPVLADRLRQACSRRNEFAQWVIVRVAPTRAVDVLPAFVS